MIIKDRISKFIIFLIPLTFLIIGIFTLRDYGISWDEPLHFNRGQAFFHYLITGKTDYNDIFSKKSYFQNDSQNGAFFLENDSAHPPANDIVAAFFNYIFFQKLGWLGDIESLHLFNVVSATLIIIVVCIFAYETLGFLPAVISGLAVSTYPLIFAEGHFNIKDPAETAFISLAIYLFWKSLNKFNWKYLIGFGLSVGFAMGVKFNVFFLPFILGPYLLVRYWKRIPKVPKLYIFTLLLTPVIALIVFYILWPYLWNNPINNFILAIKYYKDIGLGQIAYQSRYIIKGGFNLYPLYWIFVTTPPVVLFLTLIGIITLFSRSIKKFFLDKVYFLWLLWLIIPIFRVSVPGTSIYGGIRQIMEFIPAMGLFAGLGMFWLLRKLNKYVVMLAVLLTFVFSINVLYKLHPNENVYFNFIIGGLKGAKEKQIPYWGNSFGNAYLQAVKWINDNAEPNAKLALIQGTSSNIPVIQLRDDIKFSNTYWSGIDRKGEYLVELTHDDPVKVYYYQWDYVEKFLDPVYEVKVDGVAIAKVWKNSLNTSKPDMRKMETKYLGFLKSEIVNNVLSVEMEKDLEVSHIVINFNQDDDCTEVKGNLDTRIDGGKWIREREDVPFPQLNINLEYGTLRYYFPGRIFKSFRATMLKPESCLLRDPRTTIFYLK